ncbi:hypothetical protein GB937_003227 [Aspergillus fischeri]|nr:hypothetical protein GB937_003227 [Aspergillus fischeri]
MIDRRDHHWWIPSHRRFPRHTPVPESRRQTLVRATRRNARLWESCTFKRNEMGGIQNLARRIHLANRDC